MRITTHRGSRQVGGSCVEVACAGSRIVIDAGLPLDDSTSPVLPAIPGLAVADGSIDAILLSHAHPDHGGLLHQTDPQIPVWCSKGTSKMLTLMANFASARRLPRERIRILNETQDVGEFRVTAFPVDHSIYGSCAFLIEHGGKRVLYSGDLRTHGRKPGMIQRLTEGARRAPLDALILEGTHIGSQRPQGATEASLEHDIADIIRETNGPALCLFSPLNLDRLVTFYKATRAAGRVFVPDLYAANCIRFVKSEVNFPFPNAAAGMRVYFNQSAPRSRKLREPFACARIDLDELTRDPSRFTVVCRPSMIQRDFTDEFLRGATGIYSMWTGYLVRPEWVALRERLARCGGRFEPRHVSGHLYIDDVVKLADDLAPKMILPIHTSAPEHYPNLLPNHRVAQVSDGQSIDV